MVRASLLELQLCRQAGRVLLVKAVAGCLSCARGLVTGVMLKVGQVLLQHPPKSQKLNTKESKAAKSKECMTR